MNRFNNRVSSLLTVFLSIVATLLLFSIVGCTELRPLISKVGLIVSKEFGENAASKTNVAVRLLDKSYLAP